MPYAQELNEVNRVHSLRQICGRRTATISVNYIWGIIQQRIYQDVNVLRQRVIDVWLEWNRALLTISLNDQ